MNIVILEVWRGEKNPNNLFFLSVWSDPNDSEIDWIATLVIINLHSLYKGSRINIWWVLEIIKEEELQVAKK